MVLWYMFAAVVGVFTSIWCGISEMNFLGSYLSQSPVYKVFQVFGVTDTSPVGTVAALSWSDMPAILESFINALMFNYACLDSAFGVVVRVILIACVSLPVLIGIGLHLYQIFVPWAGSGSS